MRTAPACGLAPWWLLIGPDWVERQTGRRTPDHPSSWPANSAPHPGVVRPPPEANALGSREETEGGCGGERPEAACARRALTLKRSIRQTGCELAGTALVRRFSGRK